MDNLAVARGKYHTHTHTMAGALPPLGGLSLNENPPPEPPPPADRPALPPDISEIILAEYLARLDVDELCEANLLLICMGLRGTNQCNDPDDPLWKAACARFGLTERLVGGTPDAPATPTWHVTFLAMCREVATMVKYSKTLNGRDEFHHLNLNTFMDLMDGYSDAEKLVPVYNADRHSIMQLWFDSMGEGMICTVYLLLKRIDDIVDLTNYIDGSSADDYNGNYTALWQLSGSDGSESYLAIIDMLIAAGADVNTTDEWGYTPLHRAAESGNVAIVERLLAADADVNPENPFEYDDDEYDVTWWQRRQRENHVKLSPLDTAVKYGHIAVVELLLVHGADINARDGSGKTALINAILEGNVAVVKFLLANGANLHAKDLFGHDWLANVREMYRRNPSSFRNSDAVLEALRAADAAAGPDIWDEE